jgi:hypothetical protein
MPQTVIGTSSTSTGSCVTTHDNARSRRRPKSTSERTRSSATRSSCHTVINAQVGDGQSEDAGLVDLLGRLHHQRNDLGQLADVRVHPVASQLLGLVLLQPVNGPMQHAVSVCRAKPPRPRACVRSRPMAEVESRGRR